MTRMTITLTTIGRTTGQSRPVTLYAFQDGDDLIVVGSLGGSPRDPAWAGNLRAEPRATVRVGKPEHAVRAREVKVPGEERDRLWKLVTDAFRHYETYQRKTDRVIPLFVLEPIVG